MTRPLLYTYRRCPYAIRARMALLQAGVEFDAQEIVLRDKPADMLAISPKGTVPVLLLPNGQVLEESLDIMRWAFEENGGADLAGGWWPRAQTPANEVLIALNDGSFKHHLDRYKYPERFGDGDGATNRLAALTSLLEPLNDRLSEKPYLGGDAACAADLAIFPFVRQFRAVNEQWFDSLPLLATHRWLQAWLQGEQFQRCMKKLALGERAPF
ncbi:MAG: glutathione S-transferase [Bdellovibrionales bacterium]|nr:glutathione S-transferase [Ramlibacter sp.]